MKVNTGVGYLVKDGKKISKYDLPPGDHASLPEGVTFVEVNTKEDLDAVVLDKSDEEIALEAVMLKRANDLKSAGKKLMDLGLTQDEVNALIG